MSNGGNILKCMDQRGLFTTHREIRDMLQKAMALNKLREDPLFSRALCNEALKSFWSQKCAQNQLQSSFPEFQDQLISLDRNTVHCADLLGKAIASLPLEIGAYYLSSLYVQSLPELLRAQFGMFFTPPPLVDRLIATVTEEGFDWLNGTAIDPACGGGAFIAPIARKMISAHLNAPNPLSPPKIEAHVLKRIRGIEIESFSAWMSGIFLRLTFQEMLRTKDVDISNVIQNKDTLEASDKLAEQFDLVIGNPPYGRITLPERMREKFKRSLYGHANLYGIFTHIAVNLTKSDGFIAFVTPTSFLGGQYFRNLRKFLKECAPLQSIDFINQRQGVFYGVLQETSLTLYKKSQTEKEVSVQITASNGIESAPKTEKLGRFRIGGDPGAPWILPRESLHACLLKNADRMKVHLADLGYEVNTGPLVWNRHKDQLAEEKSMDALPLVWAESVQNNGRFKFSHERRNHLPYIRILPGQEHLVTKTGCILVQRTTAKEQNRRIVSAELPEKFVHQNRGAVIENHLNIVRPSNGESLIDRKTLNTLLNSSAIDNLFRCINGSVAVSAYEIRSMPLPDEELLMTLQKIIHSKESTPREIENYINSMYGIAQ
ncbi:MAG: Eco57I restriction-modification methylase domain-containing protein [Pontiellaceae bacterium]|nr:Eco57I restriction-modification methylase domain-containing protein [Pontiellaceae bacterium]